jgi:polyhydroxybutyrate depolymerase
MDPLGFGPETRTNTSQGPSVRLGKKDAPQSRQSIDRTFMAAREFMSDAVAAHRIRPLTDFVAGALVAIAVLPSWTDMAAASPDPEPSTSVATSGTQGGSPGCRGAVQPSGEYELTAVDSLERRRTFRVVVPKSYTGRAPLALVFGFHGSGGSGADIMAEGIQRVPRAADDAIIVAPNALPFQGGATGWDDTCTGSDMALFDRILTEVQDKYCTDPNRVFAFGHSWGGDFVTALACCRGDRVSALAINAASDEFKDPADYRTYMNSACRTQTGVAIRFTHARGGDNAYPAPLFSTTSKLLRSFNACKDESHAVGTGPCVAYEGCAASVVECAYPGLGHRTPPGFARDTWEFFRNQTRRKDR